MRVKTDARRQAILDAAAEVFRETGFERATMSAISDRVGGSKATLYGYFGSKEELFLAVVFSAVDLEAEAVFDTLKLGGDLRRALEKFGALYLKLRISPEVTAIQRMIMAESGRSDLGCRIYERGPKKCWLEAAELIEQLMDAGRLRRADPWIAASQLKALLECGVVDRAILGVEPDPSPETLRKASREAVDTFLRAFGQPGGEVAKPAARAEAVGA